MVMSGPRGGLLIVVGVHGTTASDAAVDWAAREARRRRAAVHLVLARDPASLHRAPYAGPADPAAGQAPARVLASAASRTAGLLSRARVTSEVADGLPARVLLDRAAGAALLVLGATRPAGDPAAALGPVTRACLRHSPCPVVIVAQDARHNAAVSVPRVPEESAAGATGNLPACQRGTRRRRLNRCPTARAPAADMAARAR
jgi:nucleotide-binding universal stress UspA family protein